MDLATTEDVLLDVTVKADPNSPGAAAEYTITFKTDAVLRSGTGQIILDIDSSVGVPTSLDPNTVRIRANDIVGAASAIANQNRPLDLAPIYRVIPGTDNRKEYKIRIPNMDAVPENPVADIAAGATVTLTLLSNSGFTNPSEANLVVLKADGTRDSGGDDFKVSTNLQTKGVSAYISTPVQLFSDDKGDNRNKPLTITGKGFKDGSSVTVYLDRNKNGFKDSGDVDLSPPVTVASNDTFEATFNVTVPPFVPLPSKNVINAIDGESPPNTLTWDVPDPNAPDGDLLALAVAAGTPTFEVEGLITVSPRTLGIGDKLTISLVDWPSDSVFEQHTGSNPPPVVSIGGIEHDIIGTPTVSNNRADFDVKINNDVSLGTQQVEVSTVASGNRSKNNEVDNATIVISGADLVVRPQTVVANQSLSVTGHGFSDGATINESGNVDAPGKSSQVSFGGGPIKSGTARSDKINDNETVMVDNGGNWASTIVVPVSDSSVDAGPHILKVVDSAGRTGVAEVIIAERTLTLSPIASRVGTMVTLTGSGFPAQNSATGAESIQVVTVEYDEDVVASVTPDSSGSFTTTFRVPLKASIPSTNSVRASFRYADTGDIHTLATHEVPEGAITLSATEAKPGDTITVTGEGFKAFTTLGMIEIGSVEVTPSPKPSTQRDGTFTATVLVPALDLGIKNFRVEIGGGTTSTVASASLTIVEETTTMMPEVMMSEAATPDVAFAAVIAEDNLITVYHFDPATQSEAPNFGWTLYDARPLFMGGNNLDMVNPSGFYFVEVSESQMGVSLGGRTMDLYAGLNPIVW